MKVSDVHILEREPRHFMAVGGNLTFYLRMVTIAKLVTFY